MNIEKFLMEVFDTCLSEENGSIEHITEHVSSKDVIDVATQLKLDDIAKLFKKLKNSEGDKYDKAYSKLKKMVNKEYYDAIDKIYQVIKEQPKEFSNGQDDEEGFCKKITINKQIGKVFVTDVILCDDEDTGRFVNDEDAFLATVKYSNGFKDDLWFDECYSDIIMKIAEIV